MRKASQRSPSSTAVTRPRPTLRCLPAAGGRYITGGPAAEGTLDCRPLLSHPPSLQSAMRCLLCVPLVLAAACAAPQGGSYGAPPPLTAAEEERAAALSGRPPLLGAGGRLGPLGGPLGPLGGPRVGRFGGPLGGRLPNGGNPPQLRPDGLLDGPGVPYSFNWAVDEPDYGNQYGHQEESDGVVTQGEYRVLLPDGRTQIVTYSVEGDSGFQATVTYEGEAQFPPPGAPGGLGGPAPFGSALGGGPLSSAPLPGAALGRGPLGRGPLGRGPFGARPLLGAAGRPIPGVVGGDVDAPVEPSTSYGI
ncbi:pro-resilin-like [Amphibalanus amphitrite]|uniref:pro-resilin-like n=1 Tax=Amphibalanus amphitrite TaxID=1232801 RepID=UPI001C9290EE|nr:pro-resilin-like [Amphibalanus amphitrite]